MSDGVVRVEMTIAQPASIGDPTAHMHALRAKRDSFYFLHAAGYAWLSGYRRKPFKSRNDVCHPGPGTRGRLVRRRREKTHHDTMGEIALFRQRWQ